MPFATDSISFGKRKLRNHRRVDFRNRCRAFAGPKAFAVTFLEEFGTFAGEK